MHFSALVYRDIHFCHGLIARTGAGSDQWIGCCSSRPVKELLAALLVERGAKNDYCAVKLAQKLNQRIHQ